ncbi:MAG: cytochrome c biogenesis protein CcsA [Saprospiraceae bacterium]|jgi:heme exporter protein C|nr:cytochrome c biogenesis protein CcsA [Saprospiraceae bacterium]
MNFLKKHGYKLIGSLLILYTLFVGLSTPLKPGITYLSTNSIDQGQYLNVMINGYNTHFKTAKDNRAWLKIDSVYAVEALKLTPISETEIMAYFLLPNFAPDSAKILPLGVLMDNSLDGHFERPSAIFYKQNSHYIQQGKMLWTQWPMNNLHTNTTFNFPYRNILQESIRNTYYHVPMWFAMIALFFYSMILAIRFIRSNDEALMIKSVALIKVGFIFGVAGLLTGALWAKYTWGQYWSFDVKQNMSAIALMIYGSLLVLRNSITDPHQANKISAAYNIFAFAALIPLIFIIPRLTDSLHPGNGGNPAFGSGDLENTMRMVFYPAVLGWILFGLWMAEITNRLDKISQKMTIFLHNK